MMTPSTDAVTLVSRSPKGSATTPSTSPMCTWRPSGRVVRKMPLSGERIHVLLSATTALLWLRRPALPVGSISSAYITSTIPRTPMSMAASSKRRASPASYNSIGRRWRAAISRSAPSRAGVEIDAMGRVAHDLLHEKVREARGERAVGRAGEAAVQVTPIRQITRLMDEAMDVDDGHGEQHTADAFQQRQLQ